jgi:two-component system, NarL family, nitrate/nitrite response regulator NarL
MNAPTALMSSIEVILADNQPLTISGLRSALSNQDDIRILAEYTDRRRMLEAMQSQSPQVLLVSTDLLEEELDVLPELTGDGETTRVILLTGRKDADFMQEALRCGARGVFQREKPAHHVPIAIRTVIRGQLWFERALTERMLINVLRNGNGKDHDPDDEKLATITAREREVIELICQGLRNKEVSSRLNISEATVSHHLTSIFHKLDVEDRVSLVIYAVRKRLVLL